ncbi:MAG: hypothetical protein R3Y64_10105 [Peptostreptococcaceae bacterium]
MKRYHGTAYYLPALLLISFIISLSEINLLFLRINTLMISFLFLTILEIICLFYLNYVLNRYEKTKVILDDKFNEDFLNKLIVIKSEFKEGLTLIINSIILVILFLLIEKRGGLNFEVSGFNILRFVRTYFTLLLGYDLINIGRTITSLAKNTVSRR